jgi:hypothetical protein
MKRKKEQNTNHGYEEVPVEREGWKELKMKCLKQWNSKFVNTTQKSNFGILAVYKKGENKDTR